MQDPIQHRSRNHVVAEDLSPLAIGLIRRENRQGLLIPPGDQLKEAMRSFAIEGQISHLIDDQEMKLGKGFDALIEFVLPVCLDQPLDQVRGIRIRHPESLLHCLAPGQAPDGSSPRYRKSGTLPTQGRRASRGCRGHGQHDKKSESGSEWGEPLQT